MIFQCIINYDRLPVWQFIRRSSYNRKIKRHNKLYKAHDVLTKNLQVMPLTSVDEITQLYAGAHVQFMRMKLRYAHHAIVTDIYKDTCTFDMIHFNSASNDVTKKAKIMTETVELGQKGSYKDVLHVDYAIGSFPTIKLIRLPRKASVAVAKYFQDNPQACQSYHLLSYNCEHFVFSCTIGYAISFQQRHALLNLKKAMSVDGEITDKINEIIMDRGIKVIDYIKGKNFVTLISGKVDIPFK